MRTLSIVALLFAVAGCASTDLPGLSPDGVDGTDTLLVFLEDRGFTLEPAGLTRSTVPLAVASTYRVTGLANPAVLEVFEFESANAAETGLITLRSEVRSRSQREVYARGPLVVYADAEVYRRGLNTRLRRALTEALGAPRGGA